MDKVETKYNLNFCRTNNKFTLKSDERQWIKIANFIQNADMTEQSNLIVCKLYTSFNINDANGFNYYHIVQIFKDIPYNLKYL